MRTRLTLAAGAALLLSGFGLATSSLTGLGPLIPTTGLDFFQPGTQPGQLVHPIATWQDCGGCHGGYDEVAEPARRWAASMMGQAARDPVFHACLTIAEQDAGASGDICLRCHFPGGWLEGRGVPTDGSAMVGKDWEGVSCNLCHRMVDPVADPANPQPDVRILATLGTDIPTDPHSGQMVVDPLDRRRGPFDLGPVFGWHDWEQSSFHQDSLLCATCHDVSNPAFNRVGSAQPAVGDSYVPNDLGKPHRTGHKYDQFPLERTFSEWSRSAFAAGPIEMGGRFGGNKTAVSTCQDCHMPDTSGVACAPGFEGTWRDDLPRHDFNGANTWVLNAVLDLDQSLALYGPNEVSYLDQVMVDGSIARNRSMLERAADLNLSEQAGTLQVEVVNQTGHKLPSGYPEGRRMWIHVEYLDALGATVGEHGHYDFNTAKLTADDTTVYEALLGLDATMAAASGLPAGESFHFALNNTYLKDNRIPPRGFSNAAFEAVQAAPVAATYADGQHWDTTAYPIPCGAVAAKVTLYYQTTTKEYIEFLRDENHTDGKGQLAYDLWQAHGKSAPAAMASELLYLAPRLQGDVETLSLSAGGTQQLCLTAGWPHGGQTYWVLGSVSGTGPGGLVIGGVQLPLVFDAYTQHTLTSPNQPPLANSTGTLDSVGNAAASFSIPPASGVSLAGLTVFHAGALFDATTGMATAASTPASAQLVP